MNRQLNRGAFFAPVLYIAIIVGLVFLQFSGGSIFTENFGQIMLSGTLDIGNGDENPDIASVSLEYQGLQFAFDSSSPLSIEFEGREQRDFQLRGFQRMGDDLSVFFEDGVELRFNQDENAAQMTIVTSIPQNLGTAASLSIPYMLSTGTQAIPTENFPGLDITRGENRYILALPPRSFINYSEGTISIPGDALDRTIRYTRRAAGNEDLFELWFQNQIDEVPDSLYQAELGNYLDRAYLAWRSNRYNPGTGTWLMRDGNPEFSEDILVNLLAEAWNRNEYTRVFNEMRTAADIFPLELSYRSSAFLGNLRTITNDLEERDRQENTRIRNLINQGNAMVFLTPDLFQFATDRGTGNLLSNLVAFTESIVPASLTPLEALGLAMNYYLGTISNEEIRQTLGRHQGIIEEHILPNIIKVDEGFFFVTEQGIADSYYTVLTGRTLIEAGAQEDNPQLVTLGRNMVLSALRLADQLGFLPAQIELTAGAISASIGTTTPEQVYPLLHSNPYYPRHLSLSDYFGNGSWAYAVLPEYQIDSVPGRFTLNFENTANRTHYLFFRGIPTIDPLNGMELFGIIWRNAPDFEIYSKGRYYNSDSQTLMIKFFDDEPAQNIILFYE